MCLEKQACYSELFNFTLQKFAGSTPLHFAVRGGHADCVKELLLAPGIDVNIKDGKGMTPVMLARGKYEILKQLRTFCDFPVHTFSKVILCGNSGAGKSTLAQVHVHHAHGSNQVLC